MAKKLCLSCGKLGFCSHKGKCRKCAQRRALCCRCKKEKWIISISGLCGHCDDHRRVSKHLENFESTFKPKSEYNKYLFELYIKYLRRFILSNIHLQQAKAYMQILESKDFPAFKSWDEIKKESKAFKIRFGVKRNSGCPFRKTGLMLEELGVINFKQKCFEVTFEQANTLSPQQKNQIEQFKLFLETTRRSENTIITIINVVTSFGKRMTELGRHDIMNVSSNDISEFLDKAKAKNLSQSRIMQIYSYLNLFYRWSLSKKYLIYNPCASIKVSKALPRLYICSEKQCQNLFKFIRDEKSPPEHAFLLALILIWSLSSEDLRYAKIESDETRRKLSITFHRHKLYFKKHHNREQTLKLPQQPEWFYKLQIRFYKYWIAQYQSLKKSVPHQYLMLPRRRHIQPITKDTLRRRVTEATFLAIGEEVPPAVLRKTSGYLHSMKGDASILATLGWTKETSFDYTWVPKVVYRPKTTLKTSQLNTKQSGTV